ncbi:hypothetical protein [Burkholderia plantarii]|uniref:hypothetical protein n=1 Tax=Burkholderia plantarii TaxID=41899 RepID=UPI0006D8C3AB|nr:hypothetical protein [Burkholderia plantarii]GLZ20448.1 hypothetical protein Bpla01_39770 [Burkholderia plantarii]
MTAPASLPGSPRGIAGRPLAWRSPQEPPAATNGRASVAVLAVIDDPRLLGGDEPPFVDVATYWPATGCWTVTLQCRASDTATDSPVRVALWQPLPVVPAALLGTPGRGKRVDAAKTTSA